jgi:large subunit ribosomal protein L4
MEVLTVGGKPKGQVELPEAVFSRSGADSLLWEAVRTYLANQRQGNACTKTRGEVSGTGRKPYKQKHTGRARHGSRRSPIFVGGGVNFGPRPRDYRLDMPKRKRRQALSIALSIRHAEGAVKVIEDFELSESKTKELVGVLSGFGFEGSILLLPAETSEALLRASRNIRSLTVMPSRLLHTYAVLNHGNVVFTEQGLDKFLETAGTK